MQRLGIELYKAIIYPRKTNNFKILLGNTKYFLYIYIMEKIYNIKNIEDLYKTGIYKINCLANNKVYIGSACGTKSRPINKNGFCRRWREYINDLKANKHRNKHLQFAWNKYGENSFQFEIIEFCVQEKALEREKYYINIFQSANHEYGFNMFNGHLANYTKFTEGHKQKISNALIGRKRPLEVVQKWSNKVQQIDENQQVIAEYYSMAEAERQTGIQRQDIGQACIGKKIKKAGGYFWKKLKI